MRLHCAVVVLSSNFLRACNQHGVKRHFHEAGSLPIEFSIKLVVCHHRGGAAARRVLGRTAPGAASGRSSPTRRSARLRTACGGAGGQAKQYYGRGHRWKGGSDASVAADHTETTFGTCRIQPANLGRHPGPRACSCYVENGRVWGR